MWCDLVVTLTADHSLHSDTLDPGLMAITERVRRVAHCAHCMSNTVHVAVDVIVMTRQSTMHDAPRIVTVMRDGGQLATRVPATLLEICSKLCLALLDDDDLVGVEPVGDMVNSNIHHDIPTVLTLRDPREIPRPGMAAKADMLAGIGGTVNLAVFV